MLNDDLYKSNVVTAFPLEQVVLSMREGKAPKSEILYKYKLNK